MGKRIILVAFVFNAFLLRAQESEPKHNEIGINATLFIEQILNLNDNFIPLDPYLITYKYLGNHNTFRSGIGFNYHNTVDKDTLQNYSYAASAFDIRAGYEYQITVYRKWIAGFGVDVIFNKNSDYVRNFTPLDNVVNGTRGWVIGGGPVINIQFNINPRISLATEATMYFKYGETTSYQTFETFPELNTESTGTSRSMAISIPTNLYFLLRF